MTIHLPTQLDILMHCITQEKVTGVPDTVLHEKYSVAMCNACEMTERRSRMPILDATILQAAEKLLTDLRKKP